ncbi:MULTISPECIES: DUF4136 domain-containing protein [Stenotrophomonas]|uniref:DUF4136 domain-containing protein n=1 Tax=Stenotrophomonas TaxID=40323 RepID=UPI00077035AE|nr:MULTISPECIES: DUF4136 domain-containing protein [Stenotrophomonas]AMJ55308.1 hypothetical protein AXG53_00660 [Stenotrophomonas sp. KCTC 12332]
MKTLAMALASLTLAACTSTPTVKTDQASNANFSSYHSYYWAQKPSGVAPLVQQRIVDGIDARLRAKGWTQGQSSGDVALAAHVATSQKQTLDTFYSGTGLGGWGWRGGWAGGGGMGSATTTVHTYDVGTLVLDMFDARTQQAIWRGTASGTVPSSPEKVNEAVEAGLNKMFAAFPVGSATP